MSYILEALRKADAQRERSRLPGLQAQPHAAAVNAGDRGPSRTAQVGAVAALVLGLGAWAAWQWVGGEAVPATAAEGPPPLAAAVPPQPGPPQPASPPSARPAPPAPAGEILPPAPPPRPAPVAAAAPAAVRPQAPARETEKAAELPAAPPGAPTLAVSGGVWSQNPAQRLLIVNGQVFNEGSELAPGVRLEEVKQQRAVLSWRGQRYAVPY